MSRKAKVPIRLPKGVEAKITGTLVSVKGPKGSLTQEVMKGVKVDIEAEAISVTLEPQLSHGSNFQGLYWSLIANMVKGVSEGFSKSLEMVGVGFRAAVQGRSLELQIGVSHPVKIPIPEGLEVSVEKGTALLVKGANKQRVGQLAADIRAMKPPEPYKGKGIRYSDEIVRRKAGKAGKK